MSTTLTRAEMVNTLRKNDCTVTFKKVNLASRVMNCTLREEMLPEYDGRNGGNQKEVIVVWDLDKNAWRSFRIDSVKTFKVTSARAAAAKNR